MRRRTAATLFLLLALAHLWPLSFAPWRLALHRNADTMLNEWLVSWIAHQIPRNPLHLFDTNIFAPERATLAYSDPVIVPGLLAAPVRWLGGSPVLAFNLVTMLGLTLTAWWTWRVAAAWFGGSPVAVVAGALGAFNVHLLTRLAHLPATHLWPVPAALWLADRLVDAPSVRRAAVLAALLVVTAATSLYTLALVLIVIAVTVVVGGFFRLTASHTPRGSGRALFVSAGAAVLAGGVASLPIVWPYLRFAAQGNTRPLEMVAQFSATPAGYLASTSLLDRGWTRPFFSNDVDALFAGVITLALAAAGLVMWRAAMPCGADVATHRRRGWTLVLLAATGILLSLGPATPVYRALYAWFPPIRGLRVAARFGYLYLLVVALAAAAGAHWIASRERFARAPGLIAALLVGLVTLEAWQGPQPALPFTGVPRLYELVAAAPAPVLLVEVPFYPSEGIHENAEYVLNSTAHWQPLANGYSGFIPDSYRARTESFWFFPEDWAVEAIRRAGATHLMVHLERFGAERPAVERALAARQDLVLLGSDALGHRLFAVRR